ncbi:MAG: polysaccharide biosynthesis tyrosine autokinase [Nostocaceae cyanobacterium]|nr:polysaccharide biosynthesis tyrosine autokinase [Nostocaceae cyanobacterium]
MVQNSLNPNANPVAETEPGYGELFAVLIRRFPWFLGIFIISIVVAGVITIKTKSTYKSSMQLLVEPNYQGKVERGGVPNEAKNEFTDPYFVVDTATQLNLMRTSGLLQQAIKKLKSDYPDLKLEKLRRSLSLTQIKDKEDNIATKIFEVEYTSTDPVKTQKVLQAIREVYIQYNKKQQEERLKKGLKVIREQLKQVSDEVTTAEGNLQRFRRNQNLIDPESQAQALEKAFNNLQQQRRSTLAEYQETIARYNSLQKQLKRSPQNALVSSRLSQSSRYQSLLNEIQKTELAISQERLRFTDETPQVQKLIAQRNSQMELLQQEVGRTLGRKSANNNGSNSILLQQGQLGQIDINLASQLVETQTHLLALRARDHSLAEKEQQMQSKIKRFPLILAEYNRLQPQIQLGRNRLQQLLKAEQELRQELSKGGFDWQVVEEPLLGIKVGPKPKQNLLLGAVVGLMLGAISAFVRESSDDAVRTTAELEKQVPLPLIGTTPKLPAAKTTELIDLPFGKPEFLSPWTIQILQSPARWESLDMIFKNIELMSEVSSLKSLMVTSAIPDEGKSSMAFGLAMSAARLHKKVLLIDANLREPSLHLQVNIPNEHGLSSLLTTDVSLPNQIGIQSPQSSYIDILTAGPIPADPANLLSSPRMAQLMATFEENYDLVILDAPPVLGLVDAMLTASSCRSVVMVASIGRVTRTQLAQATAMLSRLNLIGVVANGVSNSTYSYVPYAKQNRLALQPAMEK